MSPVSRERVRFRQEAERLLRRILDELELTEVHVPVIVPNPGLEPHLSALRVHAREAKHLDGYYLHTSPEYALKAMLATLDMDVYALTRTFRDEPRSPWHAPEFTMLEWYRIGAGWETGLKDTEAIVRGFASHFLDSEALERLGVSAPFARVPVFEAFELWVGAPPDADDPALRAALRNRGVWVDAEWDWETLFSVAIIECVEPNLRHRPTFLTHYPARAAALARLSPEDPRVAERFELYLPREAGPVELANGFGELVDAREQRRRFEQDLSARIALGRDVYPMPEELLEGLARLHGATGVALGWERLMSWVAEFAYGWPPDVADWLVSPRVGAV